MKLHHFPPRVLRLSAVPAGAIGSSKELVNVRQVTAPPVGLQGLYWEGVSESNASNSAVSSRNVSAEKTGPVCRRAERDQIIGVPRTRGSSNGATKEYEQGREEPLSFDRTTPPAPVDVHAFARPSR